MRTGSRFNAIKKLTCADERALWKMCTIRGILFALALTSRYDSARLVAHKEAAINVFNYSTTIECFETATQKWDGEEAEGGTRYVTVVRFAGNVFSLPRSHGKMHSRADVWRRDAPPQCTVTDEQMRPIYNSPVGVVE